VAYRKFETLELFSVPEIVKQTDNRWAAMDISPDGSQVVFKWSLSGVYELYVVPLAGGEPRRITRGRGMHEAVIDHARRRFLDFHHADDSAPRVVLRALEDGGELAVIHDCAADPRIEELSLAPPEFVEVRTRDGETLHGALYVPAGKGPFPTVVSVYGGPHAQRVTRGWDMTVDLRAQYLRQEGFAVFVLDNRGSARRGLAFEGALRWNMGDVEVRDQVDGVKALVARGVADETRVGIYGWSYGGYMSAMCLARAPETFRAAVAGAPVTSWDGYDTHYTERYMGTPQANADGYRRSSVLTHVSSIVGELMLVHGLLDENVHFRHTARLVSALNKACKPHDLLLLPDERHMPREEAGRVYVERRMIDFFKRALE
jgi:dipeptidyl-peptidase-4